MFNNKVLLQNERNKMQNLRFLIMCLLGRVHFPDNIAGIPRFNSFIVYSLHKAHHLQNIYGWW